MTIARNSLYNLSPTVLGVVVSVATVPVYISVIGAERYGALLIAWVLLGYFGQADFGLGRAITQRLSSLRGACAAERASVVWSALAGAVLVSAAGAVLVYVTATAFFAFYFEAGPDLKAEALSAAWLFALCVPVIMLTGVTSGALAGLERFGIASLGTAIGNTLSQVMPLLVAFQYSAELQYLLGASVAGRVIGLVPIMISMWRAYLTGQPVNPAVSQLRHLFTFGSWIMLTAIVGPLMTMSDRVVIGATISAAAVVAYAVPFQIASRTVMLPIAILQALFPRFAALSEEQAVALGKDAVVMVGQLYAVVVVGLVCLAAPLLTLWLGNGMDQRSVLVAQIVLLGFWMNAIANVPYAIIQAQGNPRFTALLHVAELPIYLAMLFGFGVTLGLYGIALAFALRASFDCVVLFVKARLTDASVLERLLTPAAILLAGFGLAQWLNHWLATIAAAAVLMLTVAGFGWLQMPLPGKRRLLQLLGHRPAEHMHGES